MTQGKRLRLSCRLVRLYPYRMVQPHAVAEAVPSEEFLVRDVPLFDPGAQPSSWNERMTDGEFALLYDGAQVQSSRSRGDVSVDAPFCSILSDFAAAERYARQQVLAYPTLRCRVYDHEGLGKPPLREFRGSAYKGESEITPRIRRWLGGSLFLSGSILTLFDWHADFRYMWASTLGTRMLVPGGTLLVVEAAYQLNAAHKRRKEANA